MAANKAEVRNSTDEETEDETAHNNDQNQQALFTFIAKNERRIPTLTVTLTVSDAF